MSKELFYKGIKFLANTIYMIAIAMIVNTWFFGIIFKNIKL